MQLACRGRMELQRQVCSLYCQEAQECTATGNATSSPMRKSAQEPCSSHYWLGWSYCCAQAAVRCLCCSTLGPQAYLIWLLAQGLRYAHITGHQGRHSGNTEPPLAAPPPPWLQVSSCMVASCSPSTYILSSVLWFRVSFAYANFIYLTYSVK